MNIVFQINRLIARPLVWLLWLYQQTLSPDHGWYQALYPYGFCRHVPSCSQFAKDGLQQRGLLALPRILGRVARCQPWVPSQYDPYKKVTQ